MKPFKAADIYAADLQEAFDYFKQGGTESSERFLARYERALRSVKGSL